MDNETLISKEVLSKEAFIGMGVYLTVLGILATTGNVIVILIIIINKAMKMKTHNLLILNLAVADLGFSASGFPLIASSSYSQRWIFGEIGCTLNGFLCTTFSLVDINTLLVLSLFRYIIICKPKYAHLIRRRRLCYMLIAGTWAYSLFWSLIVFTGWSKYTTESFGTSCSIDMITPSSGVISYNIFLTIFEYLIHILIMCFCYWEINKQYKQIKQRLRIHFTLKHVEEIAMVKLLVAEHKITLLMLAMVVTFFIIWTPYAVVCIWTAINNTSLPVRIAVLPTMFAKLSPIANPVLYSLMSCKFRYKIKNFLRTYITGKSAPRDIAEDAISMRHVLKLYEIMGKDNCTKDGVFIGHNITLAEELKNHVVTVF